MSKQSEFLVFNIESDEIAFLLETHPVARPPRGSAGKLTPRGVVRRLTLNEVPRTNARSSLRLFRLGALGLRIIAALPPSLAFFFASSSALLFALLTALFPTSSPKRPWPARLNRQKYTDRHASALSVRHEHERAAQVIQPTVVRTQCGNEMTQSKYPLGQHALCHLHTALLPCTYTALETKKSQYPA